MQYIVQALKQQEYSVSVGECKNKGIPNFDTFQTKHNDFQKNRSNRLNNEQEHGGMISFSNVYEISQEKQMLNNLRKKAYTLVS